MRIIAGTAGGALLVMPKGPHIRPTPDKVKQAVFSSLGERIVDARVLDLFTGTGALGLEAVSRGAAKALLVDDSRFAVEAATANANKARLNDRVEVVRSEVFRMVDQLAARGDTFDLIFADPPYEKSWRAEQSIPRKLLNCSSLVSILAPDGVLVMEHFKNDKLQPTSNWRLVRQLPHGDTIVTFFQATLATHTNKEPQT